MTEERLEPAEPNNTALQIVQLLIQFGYPQNTAEIQDYFKKIGVLQRYLLQSWAGDRSGKAMAECLTVLYNVIALNSSAVSPAVWAILDLVEEEKINEIIEQILTDANTNENSKVQNALISIIEGLCQVPRFPRLQEWAFAIVRGLEARKNYTVLIAVSEAVICKLLQILKLQVFRPLVYPVFRQFLYPVVTPQVFYKIIDKVPQVIQLLEKDDDDNTRAVLSDFTGLIRTLLLRFPPKSPYEAKYNIIKISLSKLQNSFFDEESMSLWDPEQNRGSSDWTVGLVTSDYDDIVPQTPYKGLANQGNTCFMNSVLQVLYMTTRFRNELLEKEIDPSERAALDLQQLFAFMQESSRSVLTPNGVMDSTLPPTFRRGHQQDSSEYLIYLLDTLHENESKIIRRKKQSSSPLKQQAEKKKEGNGDFEEGAVSLKHSNECQNTIVDRLFGGVTMSTTTCSFCEKSFPKSDSFRDLHLSLPDDHKTCDLQELIDTSLQPEELCSDNMYDCSNCGTKRDATRSHRIIKAPQHLILTLKLFRFDPVRKQRLKLHSRLKNAISIEIPVYNSSQLQTKSVMYELKGVVLHSGSSLDGGHYFSSAVDPTGQWFIFNDSVVSQSRSGWNSGAGTPYILLLRQSDVCDPPLGPLPSDLQSLVTRDNQKYLAERRYKQRMADRTRNFKDDDSDDFPPSGSLGGQGPPLVF